MLFGTHRKENFKSVGNLLSFAETAKRLKVSKAQLSKLINGKIPGLPRLKIARFGRRVLVREEVLDQWVQEVEACNAGR
jgi:excisionase family DNA binding protein